MAQQDASQGGFEPPTFGTSKTLRVVSALPFGATDLYTAFTGSGYPVNRSTSDIVAGDGLEPPTSTL